MKSTKTLATFGALAVAMGLSGAVYAQDAGAERAKGPRGPMMEQMFEQADANNDGKITQEEMDAAAAQRFADADTNGDGKLSAEELVAQAEARQAERENTRRAERTERMIARLDYDRDGLLSAEEMRAARPADGFAKMLERFDTDEDGALSQDELAQAKTKMMKRKGGHGDRDHGKKRGEPRDADQ
ncbi:EF-hand domain-containing protein [Sagittula sp. SSi028]|uniref:EF-hand domain-containing protein n=1 Tax=Sagittula sp. SSi028 TaxID=3400636 RepID=UPI003AF5C247